MPEAKTEQIAQRAFDLALLDERQLQDVWASLGTRSVSPSDFLQACVRRELMTNYQVDRLIKGERTGFFFGDYKALYLVGSGTFARVYRAAHQQTGKVVAVKVLRKRFSDNPLQYGMFVREGELGCTLRHPNIVPIYEVHSQGNIHFFVMEFVEGRNLREFVKVRKKLEPAEATRLSIDATSGLAYAHDRGTHHRDLKMTNVLISSRGRAKLVDFGLAAITDEMSDDIIFNGDLPNTRTIDYAALERATGVRRDDARSDIYFLGCTYYHMLTGMPPLVETRDRTARMSKTRFEEVVPIQQLDPNIPHSVAAIVNRSMSLDVERRYQTPTAVLNDLKVAFKRLTENVEGNASEQESATTAMLRAEERRAVMVVESNARMQDILREGFRKAGYRVLLTSDADRAVDRLLQDEKAADCVMFNAQEVGLSAVHAFNRLGEDPKTKALPAMLILDDTQRGWRLQARTSGHRIVLYMPLTLRQLRAALSRLIPDERTAAEAEG